jgi:DNA polymerase-1
MPLKTMFTSRYGEDGVIVQADLSQIELRVATMYSNDPELVRAYKDGVDLHGAMAEYVYGPNFTKEQRTKAKRTNFSAIFDISPRELAVMIEASEEEAETLLKKFKERHAVLFEMFGEWWKKAQYDGFITNFCGMERHIADELALASEQWQVDDVRRAVWNFPIQSTAADIMVTGLVLLNGRVKTINETLPKDYNVRLIGSVHDSVILDVPKDMLDNVSEVVKDVFENGVSSAYDWVSVPIEIDVSHGNSIG